MHLLYAEEAWSMVLLQDHASSANTILRFAAWARRCACRIEVYQAALTYNTVTLQ